MRWTRACLALALTLPALPSAAEHPDATVLRTEARPIKRIAPRYPIGPARLLLDGWVRLNFVVTEDGGVIDPVVESSSGVRAFERAALRVVDDWEYAPATVDGKPVEQCHTEVMITFDSRPSGQKGPKGATRTFRRRFEATIAAFDAGDLAKASEEIEGMRALKRLNHYENHRLDLLRARLALATNDATTLHSALQRVVDYGRGAIEPGIYASAVLQLFGLQANEGMYGRALATYARLEGLDPAPEIPDAFQKVHGKLLALRDSTTLFATKAVVPPADPDETVQVWLHTPARRAISLQRVQGELERIEFRCKWKRLTTRPMPHKKWKLPEDWGGCSVFVFGEPGTRFELVEHPAEAPATSS